MSDTNAKNANKKPGALSCQECRRSKLKCDRVFPCQSCIRRGCEHLCPDGQLAPVKGNKILEAHAEKLQSQVEELQTKVQELEKQLAERSSESASKPHVHPLFRSEFASNLVGSTEEEANEDTLAEVSVGIGSLSIGREGQFRYHGETAGSEYFQELLHSDEIERRSTDSMLNLPPEILFLMRLFPYGSRDPVSLLIFNTYIPSQKEALELVELYYGRTAWMYDPIPEPDFMATIFNNIYSGSDGMGTANYFEDDCPHGLSVFFLVLAVGGRFHSSPHALLLSQFYYALAKAAFSVGSMVQDVGCFTVQALFMATRFLYDHDRKSTEERWFTTGLATRAAQMIGLQRDSSAFKLDAEEVQRRRVLFFELYMHDCWQSLVVGRAPSMSVRHTDCRFPEIKNGETSFHDWKWRYTAICLAPSVEHIFSTTPPSYHSLLEMDRAIRKFPTPSHLRTPFHKGDVNTKWSDDPRLALQQQCLVCTKESNLLYIHRSYFATANREETNPLMHKYAPSVLAAYRSACRLIISLESLMKVHPEVASGVWFFWSSIFSAAIVLGALVIESPSCPLSAEAIRKLEDVAPFYEIGSKACGHPSSVSMLHRLRERASKAWSDYQSGNVAQPPSQSSSEHDELAILGGRKAVITHKSNDRSSPGSDDSGGPVITLAEMEAIMDFYDGPSHSPTSQPETLSPSTDSSGYQMSPSVPDSGYQTGVSATAQPQPVQSQDGSGYGAYPSSQYPYDSSLYPAAAATGPTYTTAGPGPVRHRLSSAYRAYPYPHHASQPRSTYDALAVDPFAWENPTVHQQQQGTIVTGGAPATTAGHVNHEEVWRFFQDGLGMGI